MMRDRDLTSGDEHTVQYTDDVLQNCTLETNIILLAMSPKLIQLKIKLKIKKEIPSTLVLTVKFLDQNPGPKSEKEAE